jgi:hypothetical protein
MLPLQRLEQYSLRTPNEVLILEAEVGGQADQIMVFKGFSSSLMHPTAFDPDMPLLPENATLLGLSRYRAPYRPDDPEAIELNLSWPEFDARLALLEL